MGAKGVAIKSAKQVSTMLSQYLIESAWHVLYIVCSTYQGSPEHYWPSSSLGPEWFGCESWNNLTLENKLTPWIIHGEIPKGQQEIAGPLY